ncbi:MAG: hypothetical protein ABIN80_02415 [Dyadobacter sp.]|uniref:hypothetical protein n=1 Tax=Dyadobacter sp. TaxID=1914288 RepID=UPI00326471E9
MTKEQHDKIVKKARGYLDKRVLLTNGKGGATFDDYQFVEILPGTEKTDYVPMGKLISLMPETSKNPVIVRELESILSDLDRV